MAPVAREECRAFPVADLADPGASPADPACLRAAPVDLVQVRAAPVGVLAVPAARVDPADLAAPVVAVPVDLAVVARADPVARKAPTTAALRLPHPARCGWRPPRGAAPRA
ncbi:hypothetical protein [Amycolatopsis sp. cmx-4-68]|uniref:hypothetical protein n=1 Tax=Amycolatopsis sp. cmx-4-68 TaxID=2790938 RepID=UPI00397AD229